MNWTDNLWLRESAVFWEQAETVCCLQFELRFVLCQHGWKETSFHITSDDLQQSLHPTALYSLFAAFSLMPVSHYSSLL